MKKNLLLNVVLVNNNRFARPNQSLSSTWISSICINFHHNLYLQGRRTDAVDVLCCPRAVIIIISLSPWFLWPERRKTLISCRYSRWPETRCNFTLHVGMFGACGMFTIMSYNTPNDLIIKFADDDIYARYVL